MSTSALWLSALALVPSSAARDVSDDAPGPPRWGATKAHSLLNPSFYPCNLRFPNGYSQRFSLFGVVVPGFFCREHQPKPPFRKLPFREPPKNCHISAAFDFPLRRREIQPSSQDLAITYGSFKLKVAIFNLKTANMFAVKKRTYREHSEKKASNEPLRTRHSN